MKLLLHTCCGPCMTAFDEHFKSKGIRYSAFFYNPNIHPYKEYIRRRDTLKEYAEITGTELFIEESFMQHHWEVNFNGMDKDKRCEQCYRKRIAATVRKAEELGFTHFTTTLLISPYQNHEAIKRICNEESEGSDVSFFYDDFRKMFRKGQDIARENKLYRQKYCGCIYSLEDSDLRSKVKWD